MSGHPKFRAFIENARLLAHEFQIIPLLYGSLGLEYLTGRDLHADDIDILIPGVFLQEKWADFQALLENHGYILIDAHEHTFEKAGVHYSYARMEELASFAGIAMEDIEILPIGPVPIRLLSLRQYLKVYSASARDGYRANVKEKNDQAKIALIEEMLKKER